MNPPSKHDQRLMDLEVRVAFMDDLVDQLNDIVAQQARQLDRLSRELTQLRQHVQAQDAGSGGAIRNLQDELPPHY